jgi:hypothetical protein
MGFTLCQLIIVSSNILQYGDHIYWTDWYRKSVERADKTTGQDRIVIRTDLDGVMEIRAVAAGRQMGWTPCAVHNGGCTHLCLFKQTSYVCACPDMPDQKPCSTGKRRVSLKPLWTCFNGALRSLATASPWHCSVVTETILVLGGFFGI